MRLKISIKQNYFHYKKSTLLYTKESLVSRISRLKFIVMRDYMRTHYAAFTLCSHHIWSYSHPNLYWASKPGLHSTHTRLFSCSQHSYTHALRRNTADSNCSTTQSIHLLCTTLSTRFLMHFLNNQINNTSIEYCLREIVYYNINLFWNIYKNIYSNK